MMRYIHLDISEKDLAMREQKKENESLLKEVQAYNLKKESLPADQKMPAEETSHIAKVLTKINETNNIPFGDKEFFAIILNNIRGETMQDAKQFLKISDLIEAVKDPGWLILTQDQWRWLIEKVDKFPIYQIYRDERGNEQHVFPPLLKQRLIKLFIKIEDASDSMPEELAKQTLSEEAKITLN